MGKIVQTAGRNTLGEFAPEFAHFNDDVLFGENWNNQDIDVKTRSIITVVALMASGITDSSLRYHLQNAKNHGVTQKEIAAVITHAAFYAGWPKAWAVFNLAKEVWETGEGDLPYEEEAMRAHAKEMVFPIGAPNDGFAQCFSGQEFSCTDFYFSGWNFQCDIRTRMQKQLAYPSCKKWRRTDSGMRCRKRILSGRR